MTLNTWIIWLLVWDTPIQMNLVTFFTSEDAILIRPESGTNIGKSR